MQRRIFAIGLFVVALILLIWPLLQVVQQTPEVISASAHGSAIQFSADDLSLLTPDNCMQVRWHVEHIRAVELNNDGVTGEGTRSVCDADAVLVITFQDGATATYTLPRQILAANPIKLIAMLIALAALGLSLKLSGLNDRLRASNVGRAVGSRLTPIPVRNLTSPQLALLVMTIILLVATAVRTHYLSRQLSADESWTVVDFAAEPLPIILFDYRAPNNHILHSMLVHEAVAFFGLQRWTIRLPAYWAGILVVAATFAVARRFFNAYAGFIASALAAAASYLVSYSVNARGYTIITLIFLLLLLTASHLLRRRRWRLWLAFVALSVIGLLTVPTTAYAVGLVLAWLGLSILLEKRGRARLLWLRDLVITAALIAIISGAFYLPALHFMQTSDDQILELDTLNPIPRDEAIATYREVALEFWNDINLPWADAALLLAVLALIPILFPGRVSRYRINLALIIAVGVPAILLLTSRLTYSRVWIFLQPLYLIYVATGLTYLLRLLLPRPIKVRPIVLVGGMTLFTFALALFTLRTVAVNEIVSVSRYSADDAVQRISAVVKPTDDIVCNWYCASFILEGDMKGMRIYSPITYTDDISSETSYTVERGGYLYFITRDLSSTYDQTVEQALTGLGIPVDAISDIRVFADLSDSVIYRIEFNRTFSAPGGNRQYPLSASNQVSPSSQVRG